MDKPFLLFIHIPKAAGTTLRSILDLQYGQDRVITYYNQNSTQLLDNLDAMLLAGRHDYKAFIGHYHFGLHQTLTHPSRYATFIRDPGRLFIATCNERRKTLPGEFLRVDGTVMSDEDYMEVKWPQYSNVQTKILAKTPVENDATESDLNTAIENIDRHFAFVGVTEYFDQSLLLMSRVLGWQACVYGRLNPGQQPEALSPAFKEKLVSQNEFDLRLHKFAVDRLDEAEKMYGDPFTQALLKLRSGIGDFCAAHREDSMPPAEFGNLPEVTRFLEMAEPALDPDSGGEKGRP